MTEMTEKEQFETILDAWDSLEELQVIKAIIIDYLDPQLYAW